MGVIDHRIAKLVFGGRLHDIEEWSCSLMLACDALNIGANPEPFAYVAPIKDWFMRSNSLIQATATLDFVKWNEVNKGPIGPGLPGGKYTDAGVSHTYTLAPAEVNGGSFPAPGQLTSAITLHTDLARGRMSKGRIFPPTGIQGPTGIDLVGPDGRLSTITAQQMADSAQEMLAEINSVTEAWTIVVWSTAAQSAHGVDSVSVGRVVDTQRRRRSSLDEARVFAAAAV